METRKAGRMSWGRISILEGKELIKGGAPWKIAIGKSVRACEDRRVNSSGDYKVYPVNIDLMGRSLKVAVLNDNEANPGTGHGA